MGKPKSKVAQTPGVGQYNTDQENTRPHTATVRIGTSKARDDVFGLKEKGDMPGPGDYLSPEPKMK